MIDYRELLMKYISHVGDCEGVTFMPREPDQVFTAEEIVELLELDEESRKYR